ncbi:acid phosphatase AphA, partial [Acinetobacter baumannii]
MIDLGINMRKLTLALAAASLLFTLN